MERIETDIPGCFELRPSRFVDGRGSFVKSFHAGEFAEMGLRTDWTEQFHSVSRRGVLRGLHFQLPPFDHAKLVYCPQGEVWDVAVDLRVGSPAFGCHASVRLSGEAGNMLYLPSGLAHGFLALSHEALMVYNVTSVHAPSHDSGIHWGSAGVAWPHPPELVSPRDSALPRLEGFDSPFVYHPDRSAA